METFPACGEGGGDVAEVNGDAAPSGAFGPGIQNRQDHQAGGLGFAYLEVTITVVLSARPGLDTRSAQNVSVIGAGDVTLNRILPALKSLGYKRSGITISSVGDPETANTRAAVGNDAQLRVASPDKVLATALCERAPAIIASPTFAHFEQLVALGAAGVPFAVEKPIASSRTERTELRAKGDQLMARGFALSYYSLEKALPLTYFLQPLPVYARFLAGSEPGLLRATVLQTLREELGPVHSVRIDLLEGASRSPVGYARLWTEVPGTLQPFIETAIHPLLLIRHITGAGTIDLQMRVAKHVPTTLAQRHAVITYANGSVTADFDTRRVDFEVNGQYRGWIAINTGRDTGRYQQNYAVLISLFREFAVNGWGAVRFDDFERQLDALDHWDDLCDLVDQHQPPVTDYTTGSLAARLPNLVHLGTTADTLP
ncbi:Gfo/Idh/MocA family oxidoreductase [Streptomyces sp. NPDC002917]|uniref:Gfo/Idh/MocA family oxidoreductase n=1 Tax=Streptomyces sp. NPDC002917 TaxID=3364671 RepID=UPI0036903619